MPNPFDSTFELFGKRRAPVNEGIHQNEFEKLQSLIKMPSGHLISLRAPRAGYGKTMLLTRLQESAKGSFLFVPVRLADGRNADPLIILDDLLTQLTEELPGGGGLTRLDIITRQLFAKALSPMVYSGEVPCQDRDGAYASLRDRPVEAFDFHYEEATIAQWCKQQFDILGPRLANELHRQSGAGNGETFFWVQQLFSYASQAPGQGNRLNAVMSAVFSDERHFRTKSNSQESLSALLNLLSLVESIVLVLDEVEGLASDPDSALRVATFLSGLWEANPNLNVILSINDDVWESSFKARLPLGLRDRYEDTVVRLDELNNEEAKQLIMSRAGTDGAQLWSQMQEKELEMYPRYLLKEARDQWNVLNEEKNSNQERLPDFSNSRTENVAHEEYKPAAMPASHDPRPFESSSSGNDFSKPNQAYQNEPNLASRLSPFNVDAKQADQANSAYPPFQTPFTTSSHAAPPSEPVRPEPENVISPTPTQPPFQFNPPVQPQTPQQVEKPNPFSPFAESSAEVKPSPFQIDHASQQVTRKEQDSVDDLLRQFRERNSDS